MEVFCQNRNTFHISHHDCHCNRHRQRPLFHCFGILSSILVFGILSSILAVGIWYFVFRIGGWYLVFGILSSVLAVGNLGSAAVDARQRIVTKSFHNNP